MILYIDPGTGSMLFTVLLGVLGALVAFLRTAVLNIKQYLSGGRVKKEENEKIPLVIFSDHKRYFNVFEPILDELEKRKMDTVFLTASEDDPALKKTYSHISCKFIGSGNKAFAYLNHLNAGVLLSTTPNLDVYFWKRSRKTDFYVHITHGAYDVSMYRMFALDYYDAVLLSGQYQIDQTRQLEVLRGQKEKELLTVGIPYLDEMKKRYEKDKVFSKKNEEKPVTVLVAPTWGESGLLMKYGEKLLDVLCKTDYRIVVRPHPQSFVSEKEKMDALMKRYPETERFSWNRDNDNYKALAESDIMISDFSGVILDYCLVFERPVIWADTEYDRAPYDCAWLEERPWLFSALERIGEKLSEENVEKIGDLIEDSLKSNDYIKNIETIKKETWEHMGEGAEQVCDYLIKACSAICLHDTAEAEA